MLFFYESEETGREIETAAWEYLQRSTWERYGKRVVVTCQCILDLTS